MIRYELNNSTHIMEDSPDGFWVRYSDIAPILNAISYGNFDDYGDLIIPVEQTKKLLPLIRKNV